MRVNSKRGPLFIAMVFLVTITTSATFASETAKENQHQRHDASGKKPSGQHEHHDHAHKMSFLDVDRDGKISRAEFIRHHEQMFDKMDVDKDGFLDKTEMQGMIEHMMNHMHGHDHGSQHREGGSHDHDAKK